MLIDSQTVRQYANYKSVITFKDWVRVNTSMDNLLCSESNCYSNFHIGSSFRFSLKVVAEVWLMGLSEATCSKCDHLYLAHYSTDLMWKLQDRHEERIDRMAERRYNEAKRNQDEQEGTIAYLEKSIKGIGEETNQYLASLGNLIESYDALSLSGSFLGQLQKSISVAEMKLEAMYNSSTDRESVGGLEERLKYMKQKFKVGEEADARAKMVRRISNMVASHMRFGSLSTII